MKLMITTITVLTATTCSLFAQTAEELKTQIAAVDQQILSLHQDLGQTPECQKLREDFVAAQRAYDDAVAKDPEISKVDKKLSDLRDQEQALRQTRADKETELAAGSLADKKAAKENAMKKLQNAQPYAELAKAMLTKTQLEDKLTKTEQAAADSQPAK
jgi:hypothetical protein